MNSHHGAMVPNGAHQRSQQHASTLTRFVRWLKLKNYQYEVTSSLYMLSPTEKVIFNIIIFTLTSMLLTAAYLYLPNHILVIYNRVYYYVKGEFYSMSATAGDTVNGLTQLVKKTQEISAEYAAQTAKQTAGHIVEHHNEL